MKFLSVSIQMKGTGQYSPDWCGLLRCIIGAVDGVLMCEHSNESY